jgi:hypothetical protein
VVHKCDSDVTTVVIRQKSVIKKTNFNLYFLTHRVNPVKAFKISSPTSATELQSMDWKGYAIAIISLLFCQGRNKILCII